MRGVFLCLEARGKDSGMWEECKGMIIVGGWVADVVLDTKYLFLPGAQARGT